MYLYVKRERYIYVYIHVQTDRYRQMFVYIHIYIYIHNYTHMLGLFSQSRPHNESELLGALPASGGCQARAPWPLAMVTETAQVFWSRAAGSLIVGIHVYGLSLSLSLYIYRSRYLHS